MEACYIRSEITGGKMTRRTLVAALLGGVAMYLWASIAHLLLPLGQAGWSEIPAEQPVLAALHSALGENSGLYMYPAVGTAPDAMQQYGKKLAANASGILVYHPPGAKQMTPGQLVTEFLTEVVESLMAIFLLAQTGIKTFAGRVGFVTIIGVLGAMATNIPYWNWYGFPSLYTSAYMTTQVVGFAAAGAVAAVVMKNRQLRNA
jgi:hypothetical protein